MSEDRLYAMIFDIQKGMTDFSGRLSVVESDMKVVGKNVEDMEKVITEKNKKFYQTIQNVSALNLKFGDMADNMEIVAQFIESQTSKKKLKTHGSHC